MSKGVLQTGLKKIGDYVYYLDPDNNGAMHTGWLYPNYPGETIYYFDSKGRMKTGVLKVDDKTYYMDPDGRMHFVWLTLKGNTYYLKEDGTLAVDCIMKIDGKIYQFDANGVSRFLR